MPKTDAVVKRARELQSDIVEMRRHLHQHPELSFYEFETAKLAAEQLEKLSYTVKRQIGKTGVIGDLGKSAGPRVAIRADMDGLPIDEKSETSYRSKTPNVMHACGHDAHVSCAIAAANILTKELQDLPGGIRMLMQPAEEGGDDEGISGAPRMIEDNAMDGVSAVIGLHMDGSLPAGKIGIAAGPVMAAVDSFDVTIKGKGGHGAFPDTCVDAVVIGSAVVQAIQNIVSRRISPVDPAVITIGSFQSSSVRGNVISDEVKLLGTFRTFDADVRKLIKEELEKACSISKVLGGDYTISYDVGYPPTVNHPKVAEVMREVAEEIIGKENVIAMKPKTWSEDFSYFANMVPGAFMFLGGKNAKANFDPGFFPHHTATFDIDESGLWIGSAILAESATRLITKLAKEEI
ncbi:MAG TPA: amidohydrolase [Oculatellaceae cyanobacterium]